MKRVCFPLVCMLILAGSAAWAGGARHDLEAAYLASRAGDPARAVRLYTRAIDRRGLGLHRLAVAHFNRAVALRRLGLNRRALADYNQAVELWPSYARAYNNRGYLHLLMGDNVQALRDLSQSLALQPDNPLAHLGRGIAYQRMAMYDWAVKEFTRALELNPNRPDAYQHLAWLLATCPQKKYRNGARAVCLARRALFISPGPMNHDALAAAYAEIGRYQLAVKNQRRAIAGLRGKGQSGYFNAFSHRLALYRSGRPFRDSGPRTAP